MLYFHSCFYFRRSYERKLVTMQSSCLFSLSPVMQPYLLASLRKNIGSPFLMLAGSWHCACQFLCHSWRLLLGLPLYSQSTSDFLVFPYMQTCTWTSDLQTRSLYLHLKYFHYTEKCEAITNSCNSISQGCWWIENEMSTNVSWIQNLFMRV